MASFDEYRKKMNSKYGDKKKEEDEKDKKESGLSQNDSFKQTETRNTKSGSGSSFDSLRKEMERKYNPVTGVDHDYINSFTSDAERFLNSAEDDYNRMIADPFSDVYDTRQKTANDLRERSFAISQYLDENKNSIDEETLNGFRSFLDEFDKASSDSRYSFYKHNTSMRDLYSQFNSEDEFNEWYEDYKRKQEMANSEQGKQGWEKYLADREAANNAPKYDLNNDGRDAWWEKALGYLGGNGAGVGDSSLPGYEMTQVINDLRTDESHRRPKDSWSEEQKNIFGYLYATSPAQAYQYAEETNNSNNRAKEEEAIRKITESATSNFWAGAGHSAGAIAAAPLGLADYLQKLALMSAGREVTSDGVVSPFEYSQAVKRGVSEHLNEEHGTIGEGVPLLGGKGWGDVYGLGMSTAQSLASAYTLGPTGTLISYFGQGAASGMEEALARGASDGQAALYGTALGVFEGLAEKVGIDNLFKLGSTATVKGFIRNILNQAGAEGLEEGLTALFSNIADNVIMQDKSAFNFAVAQYMTQGMSEEEATAKAWWDSVEGIAFDTIAGAASGGVSGGIHTTAQTIESNMDASQRYSGKLDKTFETWGKTFDTNQSKEDITALRKDLQQGLVAESVDIDPDNAFAQKMRAKVDSGKSLSGGQINRLIEANETAMVSQDKTKIKAAVEARLTELGEKGDVGKIADVITKIRTGGKITKAERAILTSSTYGRRVSTEANPDLVKTGEYTSKWAENIGTDRVNANAYNKEPYTLDAKKPRARVNIDDDDDRADEEASENAPVKEIAAEGKFEASETGKTRIGDTEVSIKEIASVKDGEMILRLEDDSTVNANDVEFGSSEEALLYENVVDMNMNAATANAFIKGYNPSEGLSVEGYALGFREAYRYGEYGFPAMEMTKNGFSASLSESQRSLAYGLGNTDMKYKISEMQAQKAKIASTVAINADKNATKTAKKGKVHYEGGVLAKSLTKRQSTSLQGLETIANALGVDIYLFESEVGENGKRKGANGWYDPKDGSIHIDLYAGQSGEGTILFTAAHELTHFIREWSPAKFKVFADFLLEQYGQKGISVDALVRNQIAKAKRNGRDINFDTAYEEVIADSCEAMLADGEVIQKLAELKAKDKTLWEKIKGFIADLVAKIKAAYKGLSPDSVEGRYVADMLEVAERLKALWTDALADASDNYAAERILGESGIVVDSEKDFATLQSVRDVLDSKQQQKVAQTLAKRFDVTVEEAMGWISAETSLASLILNPKYSQYLDYVGDASEEAIKSNSDYPQGTVDFSNICKKRRDFTEVMNRVLRNFPNHVFEATDLAKIRTIMSQEGMEVACGICYVEDRRQLDSIVAQDFIDSLAIHRQGGNIRPDGKPFNANQLKAFKLIEGDSYTPSIYELISLEGRNSLKAKNPAMEEAWVKFNNARGMQSVRLLLNDAEYKRQILKYTPAVVKRKNDLGGLRIYSFSDMEMFHLIDIIQVITDSATVGLSLQGYTKVNEYAKAVKDTGEKLNRSLIPKGDLGYHMEDGKVVLDYDTVEGIDINHPDFFDNIDNPSVGNIVIGINATQIRAAMKSKFIDQIIPFHTGQSNEVLGEKGIAAWVNYKDFQSERDLATGKKASHQINIYTEVIQAAEAEGKPITNKVDFVNKFLEVCKANNLQPRFSEFLNVDENGDYTYTEGYHKFLVDFKTFDQNTGEYLPQMPVKPIFDNEYLTGLLKEYVKTQKTKDAHFADTMPKVLERITAEIVAPNNDIRYSDRDGNVKDAAELSEKDLEYLLEKAQYGELKDSDYIPLRRNTPEFFIGVVQEHSKGAYFIENYPMAATVEHLKQNMEEEEGLSYGEERPHGFSVDDIITISRKMGDPSYIVLQENGRYAEVVSFYNKRNKKVIVAIDFANPNTVPQKNYKHAQYMNGYGAGCYNIVVTQYEADDLRGYLEKNEVVYDKTKMNGRYQVGSGRIVTVTHDTPFIEDIISQPDDSVKREFSDVDVKYSIREEAPPKNTKEGYKVFVVKNGKLYPPMVANPNAEDTPVGVWLNADVGTRAPDSKTGRMQVKAGGKGTQGGSGSLAFRPGWHLGETPLATQFDRLNPETGVKELFPENFVWALCDIAADHDYQEEAMSYGYTKNGKFQHSLAGLPKLPTDGYYKYRTNPNPDTVPWLITGAMKVKKLLSDAEVNVILAEKGLPPKQRVGGDKTLADLGLSEYEGKLFSDRDFDGKASADTGYSVSGNDLAKEVTGYENVPDSLMGYRKAGREQKGFDEQNYPYVLKAWVSVDGGQTFDADEIKGMNRKHAIERAKRNWPYGEDLVLIERESDDEHLLSDRDPDSVSNRSLLANALESVAQNDIERNKLAEYKRKIALIESEQAKLAETREKIRELSFAKGKRDTETINQLQFEANQSANRINTYDRQLLSLESTKALKGVLDREKQLAYKKAEKKGKEALAKQREKDAKTQRELLTRYQESRKKGVEGRRKTEMRHKIKDVVNELNQYLLKGTKEKHVPIELQKAVAEALDAVNMDTVGAEERLAEIHKKLQKDPLNHHLMESYRRIMEQGERMDGKLKALKDAYDEIVNSDDPLIANSHDEVISNSIARVIKEVGNTPLRDMNLSQLEEVYDMYRMVLTSIRKTNKAFKAAKGEEISTIANGVIAELVDMKRKSSKQSKGMKALSEFDWNNLKPVYAFERIGSANLRKVFNAVRAGEDVWAVDITEAKDFSKEQREKYHYDSWDFKRKYGFETKTGEKFELDLGEILSLYAYAKDEHSKGHLTGDGFVFDPRKEVVEKTKSGLKVTYNVEDATSYNISEEMLGEIIGTLTPDQKEFADAMQDYLSTTMGAKGNEVSLALYDIKLFKKKDYFPLKVSHAYMAIAKEKAQGDVKIKNKGFTKERKEGAKNPIVLTSFMDVWADHVNEMSMYHAFTLPLEDFYRVFNYKAPGVSDFAPVSVNGELINAHGNAAVNYIEQLLKDLNGGARVDPTAGIINKLTGLFKKSAVFASASVVIQQPSAIARATALVDSKYFVGKPAKGKHGEIWAEVKKYAPVAVIKEMGYFDTGMGQSTVEWIKDDKTWRDKVDDIVSKAPALADEYAWCAIWNAVKRETLRTYKHLAPNSDAFLKAVGERFTEVIVKTQVYDSVLSRSANMRSKDTGMKMATAFMGEPTTSLNMLENALIQAKRGNRTQARKAIGAVVASMVLNSILVSFVYAGRDDDEDKTYAEKCIGTLTEELLDSFNPLTLIPFVKDIVSIVQGYDVERSDMAVITDLVKAWRNLGNDNRTVYRKVEDFAGAVASIFGLPAKNIMRDARAMYNTVNSFINGEKTTGEGIKNALTEAVTGDAKSNGQQLYEAMVRGDSEQIERVKGRFKDDKAITSAIRSALRENDSRIHDAAVARYNGDIAEYTRIAKAIIGERHFSQDDVVAAINSEINALKKADGVADSSDSSGSNKATSIYKMEDYFAALVGMDQASAYEVKEDIIKTDVANGKDREEAEDDFNSRFASHLRDEYEVGNITDYDAVNMLVEYGGRTEESAEAKVQYWSFKQQYPDYDLSEEAVTKYYTDVEPSGIDIDVYYDYSKRRSKCKGTDANGDGKTDSGSVKSQVLDIINSLPITYGQKDVLYYLNGWATSTLWEAPWH